jgi:hypothetical protein
MQNKSWMDAFGQMLMLYEILRPYMAFHKLSVLQLIQDNASMHHVPEVIAEAKALNIFMDFLAPNTTDQCQVRIEEL